ncbi:hypothetical protein IWX90DRAFT_445994 [Phyllosticta citrichinensis]|uniref:Uncharacterized protein n=1 Tax=Phyllosticta citrichinensis TaxID=1130410 RepID=A0ABR1XFI8_9PEZI
MCSPKPERPIPCRRPNSQLLLVADCSIGSEEEEEEEEEEEDDEDKEGPGRRCSRGLLLIPRHSQKLCDEGPFDEKVTSARIYHFENHGTHLTSFGVLVLSDAGKRPTRSTSNQTPAVLRAGSHRQVHSPPAASHVLPQQLLFQPFQLFQLALLRSKPSSSPSRFPLCVTDSAVHPDSRLQRSTVSSYGYIPKPRRRRGIGAQTPRK